MLVKIWTCAHAHMYEPEHAHLHLYAYPTYWSNVLLVFRFFVEVRRLSQQDYKVQSCTAVLPGGALRRSIGDEMQQRSSECCQRCPEVRLREGPIGPTHVSAFIHLQEACQLEVRQTLAWRDIIIPPFRGLSVGQ